jgi:hypothetical protein
MYVVDDDGGGDDDDDDHQAHVDGVRLRLSTAATNGPIVHPPGDNTSMDNHGRMKQTEKNS